MDKVIIFGTYDFVGFSVCEKLLDEGIQVVGYRFTKDTNEDYLDEKRLLIGRNSNFEEEIIDDNLIIKKINDSDTVLLISFYDFYFSKFDLSDSKWFDFVIDHFNKDLVRKIVFLLPNHFLYEMPSELKRKINTLKKDGVSIQSVYLPTIYGPWQSPIFLFQQIFLQDYLKTKPTLNERETTEDAIYIEDVVEEIYQILLSKDMGNMKFQSRNEGQWEKGAKYLQIEDLNNCESQKKQEIKSESDLVTIKIMEKISIEEGLNRQKQHLSRIIHHT